VSEIVTIPESPGGYPVRFPIDLARTSMNRLWGIPFLGIFVRSILAIPVFIVLWFVGIGVGIALLVSWIPVLFTGRQAGWIYGITGFYVDWLSRASSYLMLLVGGYPITDDFGARLQLDRDQPFNRLWGIPIIGLVARWFLLIPHFIVLFVLGIGAVILAFVSWIPVLINGRQSQTIVDFVGGYIRWYARVIAYQLLVSSPYPPFRLTD
jgi:Domain of unknown function (DUF4389)